MSESIIGDLRVEYDELASERGVGRAVAWYAWQALVLVARYRRPGADRAVGRSSSSSGASWLNALRFVLRRMRGGYRLAAGIFATVAVALAANVVVFALLDVIVLEPLPYPEGDRLVAVRSHFGEGATGSAVSLPDLRDLAAGMETLEGLAGFGGGSAVIDAPGGAVRLGVVNLTEGYFDVLGVRPASGRTFTVQEHRRAAEEKVVILSDRSWRTHFGGDPAILGREVPLDGRPAVIVGVMPPDHWELRTHLYSLEADLWRPLIRVEPSRDERCCINAVGRLATHATIAAARAEARSLATALENEHPDTNRGWQVSVVPLLQRVVGPMTAPIVALVVMAVLVFVVGISNIAALAVIAERRFAHDMRIQCALGASRRQILREGALGALIPIAGGGIAGIVLARGALPVVTKQLPWSLPEYIRPAVDPAITAWGVGLTFVAALLVGLAASLPRARAAGDVAVRAGRGGVGGGRRVLGALVTVEAAVAFAVVVAGGLMVRSVSELARTELGFEVAERTQFNLMMHPRVHSDPDVRRNVVHGIQELVGELPGVRSADVWGWGRPTSQGNLTEIAAASGTASGADATWMSRYHLVSPEAMANLGLVIAEGRGIERSDETGDRVAVVNRALADRLWPDGQAIGQLVRTVDTQEDTAYRIVGVIANAMHTGRIDGTPEADGRDLYLPWYASPTSYFWLIVDSPLPTEQVEAAVREALRSATPDVSVTVVHTLDQSIHENEAPLRSAATAIALFAFLAILQAALGLYASSGYFVETRRREFAVRRALGASDAGVVRLLLRDALALVWLGLSLGLGAAAAGRQVLRSIIYAVGFFDPATLLASAVLLTAVGVVAAAIPALRATRVPMIDLLRGPG